MRIRLPLKFSEKLIQLMAIRYHSGLTCTVGTRGFQEAGSRSKRMVLELCPRQIRGRYTAMVVPIPGVLCTVICPPACFTIP